MSASYWQPGKLKPGFGSSWPATSSPVPTSPPLTGLKVWLRSDTGIVTGTGVATWQDQSGNGNNYSQGTGANQPTVTASAINGLPSIDFNGTTQQMGNSFSLTGAKYVAFVRKLGSLGTGDFDTPFSILCTGPGMTSHAYTGTASGYQAISWRADVTGTGNGCGVSVTHDTAWHFDEWSYTGGDNTLPASYGYAIDGASKTVLTDNGWGLHSGASASRIGADYTNGGGPADLYKGSLAAMFIYDHVLSAGDILTLRQYVQGKYGLSLGV